MSGQSQFTVGEYIPDSPVPFEAGYIFGVYQPRGKNSRLIVRYASVPSNGPKGSTTYGYIKGSKTSLEVFDVREAQKGNDYPLVAVNTSKN